MNANETRILLSRASLAQALDMSESTVDEMVRNGKLPAPVRLSRGCVRWKVADVLRSLDSLGSTSEPAMMSDPAMRGIMNVPQ